MAYGVLRFSVAMQVDVGAQSPWGQTDTSADRSVWGADSVGGVGSVWGARSIWGARSVWGAGGGIAAESITVKGDQ